MSERAYQADTTGADGRGPGTKKDPSAAHAHDAGASCAAGAAIRPGRTAGWEGADGLEPGTRDDRETTHGFEWHDRPLAEAIVSLVRIWAKADRTADEAAGLLAGVTGAMMAR